ncbi:MAG: beta-hydroxyacyl-ACP dehydratase [Planctomycetaceae bacterium]|nr:beta-hydroxyacyl-ACP dehydratase [Planctomycetaceae bacterium]
MPAEFPQIDLNTLDFDRPVVDLEGIRAVNPQRFEFEMLSGIVHIDTTQHLVVGFKDLTENEFWVKGHMPGYPVLPGVLMCEAAAQLCGYYIAKYVAGVGSMIGLAGIDEARFHRPVRPGKRLVMVGHGIKIHRRLTRFKVVGTVGTEKAFEVIVAGLSLGQLSELKGA